MHGSRTAKCAVVLADVVAVAASMCIAVWARNRLLTGPEPLGPIVRTSVASLLMWPIVFGRYPSSSTAASITARVSGAIRAVPFNARETVAVETPARRATS